LEGVNSLRNLDEVLLHLDGLYGYAMSLSRDSREAEDLVQETYLRAARACGQLAPGSNLKGWLFTIARHIWLNQMRHSNCGPSFVPFDDEQEPGHGDPTLSYVRKAEREGVRAAVEQLPPAYREVIVLREFEGLSYQEIAQILNCPAGTVMSRLGRAREKLRSLLSVWDARGLLHRNSS
jgi:RNA polymerase sigma-70 factor (ECF subfamily)